MNVQTRVVNILTRPASEWAAIAAEPSDIASLYTNYILWLAAIPAVCTLLGWIFLGGFFAFGLTAACMIYVSALASTFIAAFVIEKLAPNFDSHGDTVQALKLVAYAYTPVWIAGVLRLVPMLAALTILAALYAIYLFYLGLPPVMKTPSDKVVPFMIVAAIVVIVISFVLTALLLTMAGIGAAGSMMMGGPYI